MTDKVDVSPKLYEAATESLVSDASATSTYEKMISVAYSHSTVDTFKKELFDTEKLIKKEFEVTTMPSPWRSAKSVVTSAMKLGIGLIDDNGTFHGKTYLQNKIKEAKAEPAKVITEYEYASKIISFCMKVPEELDAKKVLSLVRDFLKAAD